MYKHHKSKILLNHCKKDKFRNLNYCYSKFIFMCLNIIVKKNTWFDFLLQMV